MLFGFFTLDSPTVKTLNNRGLEEEGKKLGSRNCTRS